MTSNLAIINAPSNLGLRPLRPGHAPGTWRAPVALRGAGLHDRLHPRTVRDLPRPFYSPEPQPGTRVYNGHEIRRFNLELAGAVRGARDDGAFPVVVGGDCSVLLGAPAAVCAREPASLVHIDGHSDFRHPGNFNAQAVLGAVAGMDLALATGRGAASHC